MHFFQKDKANHVRIYSMLFLAFVIRAIYILYTNSFTPTAFYTNDSFSFSESFLNWWFNGNFTFDPTHPDARFGRLPGYPLFWGLHYLTFGLENTHVALAITQAFLDSLSAVLLFRIALFTTKNLKASFIIGLLYAIYPIAIYWVTVAGTETTGVFISMLFFYFLFTKKESKYYWLFLGLIGSIAFYIRPYLAILLVSAVVYIFLNKEQWFKKVVQVSLVFCLLYSFWPIRNYVISNEIILVKTSNSGYYRYGPDVSACRAYIFTWSTEFDYYMDDVFNNQGDFELPPEAIPKKYTSAEIKATIQKAFTCGSGFRNWNYGEKTLPSSCTKEVASEFDNYRLALYEDNPINSFTKIPLLNLKKILFKSRTLENKRPTLEPIIFGFRTILILSSLIGLVLGVCKSNNEIISISIFILIMYVLIVLIVRQVEMRYMLQADAIGLIGAAYLFGIIWSNKKRLANR